MGDCTLCGGRWINGYMGCSRPNCNEYRLVTECNEWPVQLGLSIRRFVHRSQVSALRTAIVERMQHSGLCSMAGRCVCDVDEAYRAVETLAAMAMEAHGDG